MASAWGSAALAANSNAALAFPLPRPIRKPDQETKTATDVLKVFGNLLLTGSTQPRHQRTRPSSRFGVGNNEVGHKAFKSPGMASAWWSGAVAADSNPVLAFPLPRRIRKPDQETKIAITVPKILESLLITGNDELPKELMVSETERSTISHDEWYDLAEFPVIDLSLVQTDRARVVNQIRTAVTEWGFFQILNHGLPVEVLKGAQSQGHKFFDLPAESKERTELPDERLSPYSGDYVKGSVSSLIWAESLTVYLDYLEKIVSQVWPDGNQEFTDTVTKLDYGVKVVSKQLLGLIAESLGLSSDYFARHLDDEKTLQTKSYNSFRFNYYPACPKPKDTLGASSHTDPNCITLLLQDKVGGLQIEKDGEWIGIRPIEDALVVNIGDILHAWTNGMCRSILHRVVVNKEAPRLSIAVAISVDGRIPISPPDELIDDNHPRKYKDLTPSEHIMCVIKARTENISTPVRNGVAVLEEHFKFEK